MDFLSPTNIEIFKQLILAMVLGVLLGFERNLAHKSAGMRTFALVSLGAALFTIISQVVYIDFFGRAGFDPSRIASQIVVGIGFLGAGLIIHTESRAKGLTTAAGLWVTAAIGMAVGYRLYVIAIFVTLLTLIVFVGLWAAEHYFMRHVSEHYRKDTED